MLMQYIPPYLEVQFPVYINSHHQFNLPQQAMDICTGKTNREKLLYLEDNLCSTRLIIIIQISVLANRLPLLAFNDICMKTKLGAGWRRPHPGNNSLDKGLMPGKKFLRPITAWSWISFLNLHTPRGETIPGTYNRSQFLSSATYFTLGCAAWDNESNRIRNLYLCFICLQRHEKYFCECIEYDDIPRDAECWSDTI